jgi:predicted DNA-binding transcriptional regulator AlpA
MDSISIAENIRLLNTPEASEYLAKSGIYRSPQTLRTYRCTPGKGPAFRKIGAREVGYTEPALDEFIASLISPPLRSTREIIAA